ncbi:hypothetical protein [Flocculibacter collagenilyticus]|uniref:hypothetical protein n=1 Tax=Flocculibacter collagenilyticus TaxID=2744479 RepID=UPI0018F553EB|nr:hypothetical protein [Flocculibacter collagenilyticus]
MANIEQQIFAIANQLKAKGVEPTTALIKTRLSKPMPLPFIIQVLKAWKATPPEQLLNMKDDVIESSQQNEEKPTPDSQQLAIELAHTRKTVVELQQQVSSLEAKLDQVLMLLKGKN